MRLKYLKIIIRYLIMSSVLVLGNGKSLESFNFRDINTEWVGCCLAFRYWNKVDIHPTFYVCVDGVVCYENKEVLEYVKKGKCKKYLLSSSIKKVWKDYPTDGSVVFIEDFMNNAFSIFKFAVNYCSGTASALLALDHYDRVHLAGFDCDYQEFIPECEKLEDGTLRIKTTPLENPNYFFNDYQREGDVYNVPNGKTIHMRSWKELSYILDFISKMYPQRNKVITNYNNKISISQYIPQRPLHELYDYNKPKEKIAFLVPSTSNKRLWNNFRETYLSSVLLPTLKKLTLDYDIKLYVGYDDDDRLYSNISLPKNDDDIELEWIPFDSNFKGKPTHIWNVLANKCINDGYEYMQVCGDDIAFDQNTEWLRLFIKMLQKNNNIGYSAGFSNNNKIPTQFLLHKKHYEIFGWIFPPQITDWQCDDFLYHLYGKKGNWIKQFSHQNVGGEPRYTPNNCIKLREMLVKRHKKQLNKYF
jgi:hypothetical protein